MATSLRAILSCTSWPLLTLVSAEKPATVLLKRVTCQALVPAPWQLFSLTTGLALGQETAALAAGVPVNATSARTASASIRADDRIAIFPRRAQARAPVATPIRHLFPSSADTRPPRRRPGAAG